MVWRNYNSLEHLHSQSRSQDLDQIAPLNLVALPQPTRPPPGRSASSEEVTHPSLFQPLTIFTEPTAPQGTLPLRPFPFLPPTSPGSQPSGTSWKQDTFTFLELSWTWSLLDQTLGVDGAHLWVFRKGCPFWLQPRGHTGLKAPLPRGWRVAPGRGEGKPYASPAVLGLWVGLHSPGASY